MAIFNEDFIVKHGLVVGTSATILSTELSTSTTTGALIIAGGVGIGGNTNVEGVLKVQNVDILAYDPDQIYVSESTGDDVTGDGRRVQSAFKTIKKALTVATTGTRVNIEAGIYTEEFPLTIPKGVSVKGSGLRATTVQPTEATNTQTCFLLNGETMVTDLTITGFYKPGYGFKFANSATITTRSPYIERVTVLTRGSVTTAGDPYGFDSANAGGGAYLDASVLDRNSLEPAMLWNECTFIVPNSTGWYMTNGARAELLNAFTYFADKSIHTVSTPLGYGGDGKTKLRLGGITGTFTPGDTLYYKDANNNILASGIIESTSTGGYVYIDGAAWGFEEIANRSGKAINGYNGASQSTAQKKFGVSSAYFDGNSQYLQSASNADFGYGTGDFCIEMWYYPNNFTNYRVLLDQRIAATEVAAYIDVTPSATIRYITSSTTITSTAAITTGTWHHIAVSRSSGTIQLFVNGVIQTSTATDNYNYLARPVRIGGDYANNTSYFVDGYIDELRISKGSARYTATFTTTSIPFVSDDDTVLLLHFDGGNGSSTFIDDALGSQNVYSDGIGPTGTASRILLADYHQFGAEIRCIGSAAVFGNSGVIADGTGTNLKLIAFNLSHIGSGKDLSDDISLVVQPNEIQQVNGGKIYYQTVDQNGDFRVGDNFVINQRTGNVSFGEATVNIANLPNLTISDGVDSVVINPDNIQVGNLNLQQNELSSQSGNIQLSPASGVVVVNGDLTIGGTLTATNFIGDLDGTATTATNLSYGRLGEIPYQTAPGRTAFIGTGTPYSVLVMGSNSATWVTSSSVYAGYAVNIQGGFPGQILYQSASDVTGFVTTASEGQVLTSGGFGAPVFQSTTTLYVYRATVADSASGSSDSANNITGGALGQVPYQTGPGATSFFGPGNAGEILVSAGAAAPVYTSTASIFVKDADVSTNLRGGLAGEIPYQTGPNATAFVTAGPAGSVLVSGGLFAPTFQSTTTLYVNRAVIADSAGSTSGNAATADQVKTQSSINNTTHYLAFVDSNNGSATAETVYTTSSFTVNPNTGYVGIGSTGLPGGHLDITSASGDAIVLIKSSSDTLRITQNTIRTTTVSPLSIYASDSPTGIYISSDNKVGIDNTSPISKFDVNGNARVSGVMTVTNATSVHNTTTGALRVQGGLAVHGGGFFSGAVTATNFIGAVSGTASQASDLAGGAAGDLPYQVASNDTAFLNIGANNSILVSNGSLPSWSTNPTIGGNLIVQGNLTVQGTTVVVDSTVTNVSDPIITVGTAAGGGAPFSDDGKDKGIAFWWNNGSNSRTGFFGFDRSTGFFTFITSASIVNEVVTPGGGTTRGAVDVNLAGGSAGQFVYQTAANTTDFISTGSMYVGRAAQADTAASSTGNAGSADQVKTQIKTNNAVHYVTFVEDNNASATNELVYTTSSFTINPSNGHVGIGVTSPSVELHVRGTSGEMLRLDTSLTTTGGVDTGPQLSFEGHDGAVARTWALLVGVKENSTIGNYAGYFAIYTRPNGSPPTERLRIDSFGKVGINNTSPIAQLDVTGGGRFSGVTTVTNATSVHNATSGALQVGGGLGVAGGGFFGGTVTATNFIGTVEGSSAQVSTIQRNTNATHFVAFVDSNNSSLTAETVYTTSTVAVNPGTPSATSTTTGALQIINGGVGVGGSVYVQNRVGFVNASNVSAVYQVYNAATNSLDTVFA